MTWQQITRQQKKDKNRKRTTVGYRTENNMTWQQITRQQKKNRKRTEEEEEEEEE